MTFQAPNDDRWVGIVLAVYNCDIALFEQQIASIQAQSIRRWLCLVSDDGSADALVSEITEILRQDERFVMFRQPKNLGSYYNFEFGLKYFSDRDRYAYIAFADQDDIWHPHKLAELIDRMESEHALLVHSDLELIDATGNRIHPSVWEYEGRRPENLDVRLLLLRNTVTGCSALFDRRLLPDILPFPNQPVPVGWHHDHWVALVAAQRGSVAHVRQPLVQYRQHGANAVGAQQRAGTVDKEIRLWLAKKCRPTLKSYRIHRDLGTAFYQRFYPKSDPNALNPFSDTTIDFGLSILKLGFYSYRNGYGSQGITLRLVFNKIMFDLAKIQRRMLQFLPKRSLR